MRRRTKWFVSLACGVAIGLMAVVFWPEAVSVEIMQVRRDTLIVTVEDQGRTRVRERFLVAAPITGRLLRTTADEGDLVARGNVLATMVPAPEDPRVASALRAELSVAEARRREAGASQAEARSARDRARRESARRRELFEQGAVSVETMEQFEQAAAAAAARFETAHASLLAAQAEVERVRARLMGISAEATSTEEGSTESVRAPVSGTVLAVYEESERVVPAGTPLFEISDRHGLEVIVDFLTEQAVRVPPGAEVAITGWGGEGTLPGRVRYVEPKGFTEVSALGVEEQRVNVVIDLLEVPDELGAEFRVEAAVVTWRADDVLVAPTSAIFRRSGRWWVFAVEGGRARLRELELGRRGREWAEIRSGLEEHAAVIVFPSDLVEDGVRVAPREL